MIHPPADTTRGARRLWLATCRPNEEGESECLLIIARCAKEARLFAAACRWDYDDGTEAESAWKAEEAPDTVAIPPQVIGVWAAPDAVWAACGVEVEGWRECPCCGLVVEKATGWTRDGDDCDECSLEAP